MRFDAVLPPGEQPPAIGARVVIPGERLISEWDTTTGGGSSFIPRRIPTGSPDRPGIVLDVRAQRIGLSTEVRRSIVLDDQTSRLTSTAVLLSVIGDVVVCDVLELAAFLDWLANTSLQLGQYAAVASVAASWLADLFPEHADAAHRPPRYETEAEHRAWADGVAAVLGPARLVPCPPGGTIPAPPPDTESDPSDAIRAARARLHRDDSTEETPPA